MQFRRRNFLISTLSIVPALSVFWPPVSAAAENVSAVKIGETVTAPGGFAIEGWDHTVGDASDQVVFRLDSSWRANWH